MKTNLELTEDLKNAIIFIQSSLDSYDYSDDDTKNIKDCIDGLYQAIELLNNK